MGEVAYIHWKTTLVRVSYVIKSFFPLFLLIYSLAFSVTLFCTTAVLAMMIMMLRRMPMIGGELGGPRKYKLATSFLFVFLWLFYVLMSSLEAYGYIQGKIDGYPIYQLIDKLPT